MKKLIIVATAVAALAGSSAFADASQSTDVTFSGSVDKTCVLTAPTVTLSKNASSTALNGASGISTIAITNLADASTAALNAASFTLTYADSYCNYNHQVGIKAKNGGMIDSGTANDPVADSGNFVRRIGYTSNVAWGGGTDLTGPAPTTVYDTDAGDASKTTKLEKNVAGANRGNLVLTVSIAADANPVVAGSYSETLTLKIGATL